MNWRNYLILFIVGLAVPIVVSRFQSSPGYMDADYYFAGGVELAKGNGFHEPYLWNYLDDPQELPHPSHTYWMPLASIVSALGMWLTGQITYAAGRLPFILLSGCIPLLTAALAFDITRNRMLAMVSGFLAVFSMYYAPFMPVPDNYPIYMLLGGSFLLLAQRPQKWIPLTLGLLAGLLTLARSDGLLWLGLAGLVVIWKARNTSETTSQKWVVSVVPAGLMILAGYFIVMGAWHYRNIQLFNSFMAPGGSKVIWFETYNQTFSFTPERISRESFINAGWDAALEDRIAALSSNAGNAFAAQGEIFLLPFIVLGLYELRKEFRTRVAVTGWLTLFVVMTVIFPFAGSRGSFFHAGAAFQMYWWVAAPVGLNVVVAAARRRGLFADNAYVVFQGMLVVLAMFMTYYLVNLRVITEWATEDGNYARVEQFLVEHGFGNQIGVIVRNPPGYYIHSGRHAVALPYGDDSVILQVAEKFNAGILVLESGGTFENIQQMYDNPENLSSAFEYLGDVNGAKIFIVHYEY